MTDPYPQYQEPQDGSRNSWGIVLAAGAAMLVAAALVAAIAIGWSNKGNDEVSQNVAAPTTLQRVTSSAPTTTATRPTTTSPSTTTASPTTTTPAPTTTQPPAPTTTAPRLTPTPPPPAPAAAPAPAGTTVTGLVCEIGDKGTQDDTDGVVISLASFEAYNRDPSLPIEKYGEYIFTVSHKNILSVQFVAYHSPSDCPPQYTQ